MSAKNFVTGIVAGVALSAAFGAAALKTHKIVIPENPITVPDNRAYCHRTALNSFEVVDTQYPQQPIYRMHGEFVPGDVVEGWPHGPDGEGMANYWMLASPARDECLLRFTPPDDAKHQIFTRYTLK